MRTHFLYLLLLITSGSCNVNKSITTTIPTKPTYSFDPAPQKILVVNSCNIAEKKYRDNKAGLFDSLLNTALYQIAGDITARASFKTEVISAFTNTSNDSIQSLMSKYGASHVFSIFYFDAYFDQVDVQVTRTDEGKKKRAFYNIVSAIGYHFYTSGKDTKDTIVNIVRNHSSRSVISGVLSAGPNIVSNSKLAAEMAQENVVVYLNCFFPGTAGRNRILFTIKEFSAVGNAINAGDYEGALKISLQLSTSPDKKIAAKAFYNCAALSEWEHNYDDAVQYLKRSMALYHFMEANPMLLDYDLYSSPFKK